jgi:hypothetical protein
VPEPWRRARATGAGAPDRRPAYYAAGTGGWRDWWTLLHPPYTAWHLSYVVIGASLAAHVDLERLVATLVAFFCAVGLSAHAADELHGRPLRTTIPAGALVAVTAAGLVVAVALGAAGVARVGLALVPFIVIGPLLVIGYNAELFRGALHTDAAFAAGWGSFPLLTAYAAQADGLGLAAVLGAAGAFAVSLAQRALSTPARLLRRQARSVTGTITLGDGTVRAIDEGLLRRPLEQALRAMSWGMVALAAALAVARLR